MVRVSASALAITLVSVMVQTAAVDTCTTNGLTSEATCGAFDGGKCRWYSDNTCHEVCFHPNIAYSEVPALEAASEEDNQEACKTRCKNTLNCAKFSYRPSPGNKHCTLYTDSAVRSGDTNIVSGSVSCSVHVPAVVTPPVIVTPPAAQAPCTELTCPTGYVAKTPTRAPNPPIVCLTAVCSVADDRDRCCTAEPTQAPTPAPPTPLVIGVGIQPTRAGTAPAESMPANIVNAMKVAQANTGMSFSGLSSRSRGLVPEEGGTFIAVIAGGGAITAVLAAITLMSRRSRESISTEATVAEE